MYEFAALLLGITMKLYDNVVDLKLNINSDFLELAMCLIIGCSTLIISHEPILALIVFIGLKISNYCKPFDTNFWHIYLLWIAMLCIFFSYNIFLYLINGNFLTIKILFVLAIPLLIFFEENYFYEEISNEKTKSRIYGIIINSIIFLWLEIYNLIEAWDIKFFTYLILFINAYFVTSIIFQKLIIFL